MQFGLLIYVNCPNFFLYFIENFPQKYLGIQKMFVPLHPLSLNFWVLAYEEGVL
jgi:hypothetical protein